MTFGRARFVAFAAAATVAASSYASAFTTSGAGGRLIAAGASRPSAIATTDGGALVVARNDSSQTFFLNRFGPGGEALWDGIAFPGADGVQLVSDGAGGALLGEHQPGEPALTIKHYLSSGASTWQHALPAGELVGAGDGIAWVVSLDDGIVADSVNADGSSGAHVALGAGSAPSAVGDGRGGIFVVWRSGTLIDGLSLLVQHVDATGAAWPVAAHVAGSSDPGFDPLLAADPLGGVAVAWHAAGELWLVNLSPAGEIDYGPVLFQQRGASLAALSADAAGIFVTWTSAVQSDLFPAQELVVTRLDQAGLSMSNVSLGRVPGEVLELHAASDPAGGVVVGWQSAQISRAIETDLHIQRVTTDGMRSYTDSNLATSLGPESFGDLIVAPTGEAVAVFSQSICARIDMQGLAMQRIAPDGTRELAPSIACP